MSDPLFQQIVPIPQHVEVEEVLVSHQVAYDFYREVHHRQAFEQYCQWYSQTAAQNRRDLAAMQNEMNILGWFYRKS